MIHTRSFPYKPTDHECERASNSYLMSLMAIIVGLPIPIVNLLATFIFFMGNRKGTYFVRWHCSQAMLSQLGLFFFNSYGFWWTFSILFGDTAISNEYVAYLITIFIFNFTEVIFTIILSTNIRKGIHMEMFFFGDLTNLITKPKFHG
jgi:hypothetical protein